MVVRRRLCLVQRKEVRKVFQEAMKSTRTVVLALKYQKRVQARISTRTKAEARTEKERVRKVLILNLDVQLWKHPVNKDMAIPGNRTMGLPAIGLTIPQPQLLGWSCTRAHTAWMAAVPLNLPTIRRALFWNMAAHDQLGLQRQSNGSKNMLGITALRRSFAFAIGLLCSPTLREKLVGKVVFSTPRQQLHIFPELMCLRRATCLFYSPFRRRRIWVLHLNWIRKEQKLHVQLVACTLLQLSIPQKGQIVLDLTSLAYQPKLREPPEETCNFCSVGRKKQHIQLTHEI